MINVYDGDDMDREIVARVNYNTDLDYWDGNNHTSGSTGHHLGITKLRDGRFVLIHGTQWQGERDTARVVSNEEALQEILRTGHEELLEENKFSALKKLAETTLIQEA